MKLLSIINKNFKVVSRNWSYFIVLVLCPIILILASGAMLNSSDIKNLKIGIMAEDNLDFKLQTGNQIYHNTLSTCILEVTEEHSNACIHVYKINSQNQIEVYFDNSNKRVESYVKQFIFQQISSMQSEIINRAGELVYSETSFLTSSIINAKSGLQHSYNEVDSLEKDLISYKAELSSAKKDFDSIYYPLKDLQSKLSTYQTQIAQAKKEVKDFKEKKGRIKNSINSIRPQLQSLGYNLLVSDLDSLLIELNSIESSLNLINNALSNYETASNDLNNAITRLDYMKSLLDKLEIGLQKNIEKTRETKTMINKFINELEQGRIRIEEFSQSVGLEEMGLVFKNAHNIEDDPMLVAFPLLIAIIISFTSIILSNLFISKQINHPSFLRDIISPTKDIYFLIANYFVTLFFVFLQILFLFLVGYFWFNIDVLNNFIYSIPLMLMVSSIFVFIGMSIGYIIKSQYLSMLISIFIIIFYFIFSDLLTPSILTGPIIRFFISINPFALLSNGLMSSIILNKSLSFSSNIFYRIEILFITSLLIYYFSKKICNLKTTK